MNFDLNSVMDLMGKDISIGGVLTGLIGLVVAWKTAKFAGSKALSGLASLIGGNLGNMSPATLIIFGCTAAGAAFDGLVPGVDGRSYTALGLGLSTIAVGGMQWMVKNDRGDYLTPEQKAKRDSKIA